MFPIVTRIDCDNDRLLVIKVSLPGCDFIVFSIYMPVDVSDNLTEFLTV